jgi:CubicO group peptidase (beta-lactamase class C family)
VRTPVPGDAVLGDDLLHEGLSLSSKRLLAAAAVFSLASSGCVYGRIVYFNFPTLAAVGYFDRREVHASTSSSAVPLEADDPPFPLTATERARYRSFDDMLEANETRAFLAIKDDRVVYERYFHGVNAATLLPDFSMSKTFAALLIGCAVADGLLGSVDGRLVRYVPEVAARPRYGAVTIDQLLRMTSGIDFNEESVAGAVLYYSTDLRGHIYAYDVKWPPGTHYEYGSISTMILWDVLRRQLRGGTVSAYFERRVWGPLGAEHDAAWSLDSASNGVEKFFAGFNATLRDHARLGLLFLHGGSIEGRTIVPQSWVERSLSVDPVAGDVHTKDGWVRRGKYQWFLTRDGRGFFAKGYKGQYVFVVPDAHMVFVRFGEGYGHVDWTSLFLRLAEPSRAVAGCAGPYSAGVRTKASTARGFDLPASPESSVE